MIHQNTKFQLKIEDQAAHDPSIDGEGFAHGLDALDDAALPSVMRKCVRMAMRRG